MWLLIAFIAVPMIEIALFIKVGGLIGLGWTLAVVLLTAVLGTWLVKQQGRQALENIQRSFSELTDPSAPLAEGAMILLSGALLLTPGFFTDAIGFALLTPAFRRMAFLWLRKRVKVQSFSAGFDSRDPHAPRGPSGDPDIIDGDFQELEPGKRPTHPSGWTRH
ncbi:FxsA family protein [Oceanicola sp. S124]|uniref:FxsA family protein n=1 Tax=Oceanicola sp. S124 TaxID=1042378 RepID=UPI0002559CC5|nr:FxsA family protein [Oceanicola sp. S124]